MSEQATPTPADLLDIPTRQFYRHALDIMDGSGIPYCVAGAYALAAHAGIVRHTKDLDIFLKREDVGRAMRVFEEAGYRTDRTHPHWLAKVFSGEPADAFVDLIFRAASGLWDVDDPWLAASTPGDVIGRSAPLCPPEELVWSKAMVMERHRFDGADIAHVIHRRGKEMDWDRLLHRAAGHEGILLGHLSFFRFIYPCEAESVPDRVLQTLFERVRDFRAAPGQVCRGTLVSWDQYLPDVNERGLTDGRLQPWGKLTPEEIKQWTEAKK